MTGGLTSPVPTLRACHRLLMAAILAHPCPAPGPLLEAAVVVADALEALEDIEGGAA